MSCDETPEGVSEVILYLLDRLSRGEQMKIKFYRNGEIKLMGYSAEVRLYGTSQRGCSSHLSSREKEEEISEARGERIKHKTVLLKNVISGLSGPAGGVKVILREMSKS